MDENSTGYEQHPAQIIKEIRGNLHERYQSGFPILKELIQNADDAENASEFHFGWSPGLEGSIHPLAQAPAIFFLNNGDFRPEHENAIKRFNYGSKALDKASVGKFGLGMKSVFHWCEAFFYLYGPEATKAGQKVTGKILNPWTGTGKHTHWNHCPPEVLERFRKTLAPIIGGEQFFCLWIPLRREQDLDGIPPLSPELPRIDLGAPASQQVPWGDCRIQLAGLIPLLHRIRKLVQWAPADSIAEWRQIYSIELPDGAMQRRSMRHINKDNVRNYLSGQVRLHSSECERAESQLYAGIEVSIDCPELEKLQADDNWPEDSGIDPVTFEDTQVKEKGEPHAAVSFISLPASSNKKSAVQFQWAVFLPVQDADCVTMKKRFDFDLRVVLHGYFFLDSGRRWIEGFSKGVPLVPEASQELRSRWNATLAREGVFPLLIPAFQHWIEKSGVSDEIIEVVTSALQDSEPVKSNLNAITRDLQWVYRLKREGGGDWDSVPASSPYFSIPAPRTSATNPLDIFPELANLFGENTITYSQKPCITSREPLSLEVQVIDRVLENVSVETIVAKPENLAYFVSFMRQNLNERVTIESTQLKRVIRDLIRFIPHSVKTAKNASPEDIESHLRSLFSGLSVPWLIPIPEDGIPLYLEIAQYIASQELCHVLVPSSFLGDERDDFIDPNDALKILRAMGAPPLSLSERKQFPSSCHKLVLYLLRNSNQSQILQDASIQHIPLIQATDCTTDSLSLVALATISEHCNIGTAFTGQREMAKLLQRATPKLPILLVDEETYQLVSDAKTGRPCHNKNIGEFFQRNKPTLGSQENRAALLSGLLKNESGALTPEAKHAYRYLLHASGENYESDETLIVSSSGAPGDIWAKVYRTVLNSMSLEWCYVEPELAATLNKHQRDELSIATIDRATTISLLKKHQNELYQIDFRAYAESEREQILEDFPNADLEILRSLPVHVNLDGSLTSIDERTFLLEDVPTCSFVRSSLNLIRPHTNTRVLHRQREIMEALSVARVLQVVLGADLPAQHWKLIAEVLDKTTQDELCPVIEKLKKSAWILSRNGSPIAPQCILWMAVLESDQSHTERIRHRGYVSRNEILEECWSHPGIRKYREVLLPSDDEQLQMLGRVLGRDKYYGIGAFIEDEDTLRAFVDTFRGKQLLPIADVMGQLIEENKNQSYVARILKHLSPVLSESIAPQKYTAVLRFLSEQESRASASEKKCWRDWHDRYLTGLAESGFTHEVLPDIQLKSAAGTWKSTNGLCIDQYGIRREDVLSEEHAKRLKLSGCTQEEVVRFETTQTPKRVESEDPLDPRNIKRHIGPNARLLEEYFNAWMGKIPPEILGGFVAFLGGQIEIQNLAQRLLEPNSVDRIRQTLKLVPDSRAFDFERSLGQQRFVVSQFENDTIAVRSIVGHAFEAKRSTEIETIFLGESFRRSLRDGQTGVVYREFWLRKFDVSSMSEAQLQEILRRSLSDLICGAYNRQIANLDQFWSELSKSEQLHVGIARQMLLDPLFTLVKQLGISNASHEEIRQLLNDHRRVETDIAAVEAAGEGIRKDLRRRKRDTQKKLALLIENDSMVQDLLLSAVRRKILDHYQYRVTSVPFEIFQNADDASVELNEMRGNVSGYGGSDFIIVIDECRLRVIHWGRPINRFRERAVDYRDRGYDSDLLKMLTLSISDKDCGSHSKNVTGKFGLGFKSVYLVTDRPRLKSGTICADIVAATWPCPLSPDDYIALDAVLKEFRSDYQNGTIIELPDLKIPASEILIDFRLLASMLLAFSRSIFNIRIVGDTPETFTWLPTSLDKGGRLATCPIKLRGENNPTQVLKVNAATGAFLFKIGANGFARMPQDIPTVWVTAPTAEKSELGFAINGPFPLDVGRAQLSRDESSYQSLAREIGRGFLSGIESIYELACADWELFANQLGMRPDLDLYDFWTSVWELLAEPFADRRNRKENNAVRLLDEVLWGEADSNLRAFYGKQPVIPTGLWNSYRTLTNAPQIEVVLAGVLERREVFLIVSQWTATRAHLRPGHVTTSAVHDVLQNLGIIPRGYARSWSLIDLLEQDTARGGVITAEMAEQYGELINSKRMGQMADGTALEKKELEALLELLGTYRFVAVDGSPQSSRDLVISARHDSDAEGEANPDEQLRAAFAPSSRVLDLSYTGAALDFFRTCRKELRAPVISLVDWALGAQEDRSRNAVLQYLLEGELAQKLGRELRGRKHGTWIEEVYNIEYYAGLDEDQRRELEGLLGIGSLYGSGPGLSSLVPALPPLDPQEVLNRIYDWWLVVKERETHEYNRKVYPAGTTELPVSVYSPNDLDHRKAWYSLFVLGMTHTMGRTKAEQHRAFLDRCRQRGWLDVFAAKDIDAESWIDVLDDFIDNPLDSDEFSHWMKLFPNLYRVSKWLDDYIDAFLAVEQFESDFELGEITSLRSSRRFQGGGLDAPSITRTLGYGACFVMRELVRDGIVSQPLAHRHCYVPSSRVRNFFSQLGCELDGQQGAQISALIHEFIVRFLDEDRATFQYSFDLPFIRLLDSREKQIEILGRGIEEERPLFRWAESFYEPGDFITLPDGRVIPRDYMN